MKDTLTETDPKNCMSVRASRRLKPGNHAILRQAQYDIIINLSLQPLL
jgi:hypothetical protein